MYKLKNYLKKSVKIAKIIHYDKKIIVINKIRKNTQITVIKDVTNHIF